MNKRDANRLWRDLSSAFANAEKAIRQIIETKAWEPLGYPSFTAAWADRMKGSPLATEALRAHVVYHLFAEGASDDEVSAALGVGSRVGPESVKALRRQRDNGVPPDLASTRVRSHLRSAPRPPRIIRVELSEREYTRYAALAKKRDVDMGAVATEAVRKAFLDLM